MSEERRQTGRHPVNLDANLTTGEVTHPVTVANLSLGGALITGDVAPSMGDRVAVEYRIPTHPEPIAVNGVVRWTTPMSFGVEFDSLRPAEVWSMNKFFEGMTS